MQVRGYKSVNSHRDTGGTVRGKSFSRLFLRCCTMILRLCNFADQAESMWKQTWIGFLLARQLLSFKWHFPNNPKLNGYEGHIGIHNLFDLVSVEYLSRSDSSEARRLSQIRKLRSYNKTSYRVVGGCRIEARNAIMYDMDWTRWLARSRMKEYIRTTCSSALNQDP